jgi:hypothetical protein
MIATARGSSSAAAPAASQRGTYRQTYSCQNEYESAKQCHICLPSRDAEPASASFAEATRSTIPK